MASWDGIRKRVWPAGGGRAVRFVLPRVVYEIQPGFVAAARLDAHARQLRRLSVREFEARAVEPVPHRSNVARPEELRAALGGLAPIVGNGNGSCGLLIPDGAVRVATLAFETLPENRADAEALVRWRMRETLQAEGEEVRLSWQVLRREPRNVELLVVAIKETILAEYEQLLEPVNGSLALVLPSTMALLPLVGEKDSAAELLLHLCAGCLTAVVVEGGRARLWRTGELRGSSPEELAREAAFEAARMVESARDQHRLEIQRVLLSERPRGLPGFEEEIGRAVAKEVVRLAPDAAMAKKLSEAEQQVYENFGTAVAGLMANTA
jgi:hypothetical protein